MGLPEPLKYVEYWPLGVMGCYLLTLGLQVRLNQRLVENENCGSRGTSARLWSSSRRRPRHLRSTQGLGFRVWGLGFRTPQKGAKTTAL